MSGSEWAGAYLVALSLLLFLGWVKAMRKGIK